jgi:hypothetical protein
MIFGRMEGMGDEAAPRRADGRTAAQPSGDSAKA